MNCTCNPFAWLSTSYNLDQNNGERNINIPTFSSITLINNSESAAVIWISEESLTEPPLVEEFHLNPKSTILLPGVYGEGDYILQLFGMGPVNVVVTQIG